MKNEYKVISALAVFLVLVMSLSIYLYDETKKMEADKKIADQNIIALNDSVRVTKNKVGQLEYSKSVLVSSKKDLERLNKDLYDKLKRTEGKVSELTDYIVIIDQTKDGPKGSTRDNVIKLSDDQYKITWAFDTIYNENNYRKLLGESKFKVDTTNNLLSLVDVSSLLLKDESKINITQGIRKKDGKVEVFVTSDHPYFSVSDISSVIIDPETHVVTEFIKTPVKKFGIGPAVGYGYNGVKFSPYIGFSFQYNIIRF